MISLVKYELYKLLKNRSVMGVLLLLFMVYLLFLGIQVKAEQQEIPADTYKNMYEEIQGMESDDILPYLSSKIQQYDIEKLGYIDEKYWQYRRMYKEVEKALGYEKFLNKINEAANNYASVSIFAKKNAYASKSMRKTEAVYADMKGTVLPIEASQGVTGVLINKSMPLFLLGAMFIGAVFMFQLDRNTGIELVERTTVRGRSEQMVAKSFTMLIIALFFTILFLSVNVGVYGILYGFGDLLRPIQSVQGFYTCPYRISVLGYFMIFILTRWITLFAFGLIFAIICLKTKKAGIAFFISASITLVMAGCFNLINDASIFVYFKYINLFTLFEGNLLYSDYRNLKIFGEPLDAMVCVCSMGGVILIAVLLYVIFAGRKRRNNSGRKQREPRMLLKPIPVMFCQVAYKMLVYGRSIVIIVIGAILVLGAYEKYPVYLGKEEMQYKAYMEMLEGPYTQETKELVAKEEKRFNDLRQSLYELALDYEAGNVDMQTYEAKQSYINNELLMEIAFMRVKNNLNRIADIKGACNVYDTGYNILLSKNSTLHFISYLVIVLLLLTVVFENTIQEKLSGMQDLTHATVNGRRVLKRHELIIYELCGLVICMIAFGGELLFIAKNYGLSQLMANAGSLSCMQGGSYSIAFGIFGFYMKRVLIVGLLIAVCIMMAEVVRKYLNKK